MMVAMAMVEVVVEVVVEVLAIPTRSRCPSYTALRSQRLRGATLAQVRGHGVRGAAP